MAQFDAYTATSDVASPEDFLDLLLFDSSCDFEKVRGQRFWGHSYLVKREGHTVGSVQWGGQNDGMVMLEVKGEHTPAVVEALRATHPHRCTRVDSCVDFDEPGAFDRLLEVHNRVKKRYGLKGGKFGDWEDFPEDGRTYMLGAPTSPVRVRMYEKGKQPEYRHLGRSHWVRDEVQVRPKGDARQLFAKSFVTPSQVWGASPFTRDIAAELLFDSVEPLKAGTVYRESQRDRALRHMCQQYGGHLSGLLAELGSWQAVGLQLGDMVIEMRSKGAKL